MDATKPLPFAGQYFILWKHTFLRPFFNRIPHLRQFQYKQQSNFKKNRTCSKYIHVTSMVIVFKGEKLPYLDWFYLVKSKT